MKFVDHMVADLKANRLRSAASLSTDARSALEDELVRLGASAIKPVSQCLSHGEARGPALAILARLLTDSTFEQFIALLASPNPTVVSGVSRTLAAGRGYDPRRLLPLLRHAAPPRTVLESILREQVERLPASELVFPLSALERDAQAVLLRTLERSPDPDTGRVLVPFLADADAWLRAHVARLLGDRPGEGVAEGLMRLLDDEQKAVRLEAVEALHRLRAEGAVPRLVESLRDPDIKVQSAAIGALNDLADVSAVPHLLAVLTDESDYVRRAAVEVLNQVATADAIEDLVRALRDADWWVRVRAADALGTLGGDRVVHAVTSLMSDPDESLRRHAVEILNAVPSSEAVPVLVAALVDPDWWVRERAIDALGKTRDPRAVDALLDLLAREEGTARLCVRALGQLGDPRAIRPLGELLHVGDDELRGEAFASLRAFLEEELGAEDRALLHSLLSRSPVESRLPAGIPMRVQGSGPVSTTGGTRIPVAAPVRGGSGTLPTPSATPAPAPGAPQVPGASPAPAPAPAPVAAGSGARFLNFADLPAGHVLLDRFRVLRQIGRGGFGTVYLVEDAAIQEEVVLKILNTQFSSDEAVAQRFIQELKLTRRISHRNVIRLHDFLDLGGVHAVSMEYFPGRDLGHVLTPGTPLDVRRSLRIATQVCAGLAAAHAVGIVHRDIKPPNILIRDDDETRVVDFGLASAQQHTGSRMTRSGLLIGTPEYMAPELIRGDASDHRVDIYAVGVLLYEMLSGHRPYVAETPVKVLFQHLEGDAVRLGSRVQGLPAGLNDLVHRAMARNVEDRPSTAEKLGAHLERIAEALPVSA